MDEECGLAQVVGSNVELQSAVPVYSDVTVMPTVVEHHVVSANEEKIPMEDLSGQDSRILRSSSSSMPPRSGTNCRVRGRVQEHSASCRPLRKSHAILDL